MLQGLRTVIYHVPDIAKARSWYAKILGFEPYFNEPFYVGFRVGGYELRLDPDPSAGQSGPGGVVAYWGVGNAEQEWKRLLELGATKHSELRDVGEGIRVATIRDPFGNVLGIIENPHFQPEA
jgi:catechol 2,3-dioxygenase-like lactoylglutathione lyase family enzyme